MFNISAALDADLMTEIRAIGWEDLSKELENIILAQLDIGTLASLTNVSPRLRALGMLRLAAVPPETIVAWRAQQALRLGCCAAFNLYMEKLGGPLALLPSWSALYEAALDSGSLACLDAVFNLTMDPISITWFKREGPREMLAAAAAKVKPRLLMIARHYATLEYGIEHMCLRFCDAPSPEDKFFALETILNCRQVVPEKNLGKLVMHFSSKRPILVQAVKHQRHDLLELLLRYGASTKIATKSGETSLHAAVRLKNRVAMQILLSHCQASDLDAELFGTGATPLHLATMQEDLSAVEALLAAGADVYAQCHPHLEDTQAFNQQTPLSFLESIQQQYGRSKPKRMEKDLSSNGMGTRAQGQRPFELAVFRNNLALVVRLSQAMKATGKGYGAPKRWDSIKHCIETGNVDLLEAVLEAGANANVMDVGGYRPLHWGVQSGNADIVASLVATGANVNVRSYHDEFPEDFLTDLDGERAVAVRRALMSRGGQIGPRPLNNALYPKPLPKPSQSRYNNTGRKNVPRIMPNGTSVRTGTKRKAGAAMVEFANAAMKGRTGGSGGR